MSGRRSGGPQEQIKKVGRCEGLESLKMSREDILVVQGNLRFPIDFTYHGGP